MVYGYARCSTNESKQDIDRQKRELMNKGVRVRTYTLNMCLVQRIIKNNGICYYLS